MISEEKIKAFKAMQNSGQIYDSVDEEFIAYQHGLVEKLNQFNRTADTPEGLQQREDMLKEMLGTYNEGLYIIPPISANCGLSNVHVGKNVVINFNAALVDDGEIFIGNDVMIGPNCNIATSVHPISPKLRRHKLQYNKPVHIKDNVWFGANVTILPGVTVGENSIVAAGSVVTKDVPPNVIVGGVPARVIREITEKDDLFENGQPIPQDILDRYM